ncbi:MAG: hypothetical protein PHP85_01415 [Gallionella sp.]|nr:hypothetical protein [Gallionella sp.]
MLKKIVLTLLLLPALLYLGKVGIADFLRLEPCVYLDSLMKGQVAFDAEAFFKSRDRLLLARTWDADNPVMPEYLGQIAYIRAQLVLANPALQVKFLREAVEYFDAAIALRPNSCQLWGSRMVAGSFLLEAMAQVGRDDALFRQEFSAIKLALRRASVLGPWEPSVLQQIVRVGRSHYGEFSAEERAMIDVSVARAKQLGLRI